MLARILFEKSGVNDQAWEVDGWCDWMRMSEARIAALPSERVQYLLLALYTSGAGRTLCRGREAATEVGILGYNHADSDIPQFTINGGNGGSARRLAEGGTACCALMPDQWKLGMSVQVQWINDLSPYHHATVPVPRYESIGNLAVHFFRNGEVKVFVTSMVLGHPEDPLSGPEAGLREGKDPVWKRLL